MKVVEVQQALRDTAQYWKNTTSPLYEMLMLAADVIDDQQAKLKQWNTSSEALAVRVMGQQNYDMSPCQAHPLELVEAHVEHLTARVAELEAKKPPP